MSTDLKLSKAQISKIIQSGVFLGRLVGPLLKTTLITSNEEMNDIMKTVQTLEVSNILLKGATKTIKNEAKEQKGGFLSMLLGTLAASLLGNLLTGKGIVRAGSGRPSSSALQNKKGKGIVRASSGHPLYKNKKRKGIVKAGFGHPSSSALQIKKE